MVCAPLRLPPVSPHRVLSQRLEVLSVCGEVLSVGDRFRRVITSGDHSVTMMSATPILMILGAPTRTAPIAAGIQRAGLVAKTATPRAALQSPGSTSGAALAILAWPPGANPILESEIYGAETGALHVWWHSKGASVGPFVSPGFGPCPGCLASADRRPPHRGGALHLTAWAASWAALQALAVVQQGTTDLMGSSWTWHVDDPGLSLLTWPWRSGCRTRGCRDDGLSSPDGP